MKMVIVAAVVLGLALAPAAHADTLFVGGTGTDSRPTKPTSLGWVNHGGPATQVGYPATVTGMDGSIRAGVNNLDAAVRAATGPITIVGASQGAVVADQYKRSGAAPEGTTFVMIGDPTSRYGIMSHFPGLHVPGIGLTFTGTQRGPYATTVISRQYDGVADWPTRPGNILADLNALAGIAYIHPNYGSLDLTGVVPIVDGNTTYYRLPTAHLPLLQPLRDLGVDDERIVRVIEGPLSHAIDQAYREPVRASAMARPQAVTGSKKKTNNKRPSCTRLVVCAG
jgi:PE-PPE domain